MIFTKSLKDLALNISEAEYRDYPALSYSVLARYEKGGFSSIPYLYDKQEGEALTFGSVVDTLITEPDKFKEKFAVADIKLPSDSLVAITQALLNDTTYKTLEEVPDNIVLDACNNFEYCMKMSDAVRVKKVREGCTDYFNSLRACEGKTVITDDVYQKALSTVSTLKTSPVSSKYLRNTTDDIEFLYQQKFIATLDGLDVKCMFDLLIINHSKKVIIPIDLKTTSIHEYDFQRKFIENRYDIQSRLYYRILTTVLSKDSYFKDFRVLNFRFLVINKDSLNPMIFEDDRCYYKGDIELNFNSGYNKILRDPVTIGIELKHYLDTNASVPDDLDTSKPINLYERILKNGQ